VPDNDGAVVKMHSSKTVPDNGSAVTVVNIHFPKTVLDNDSAVVNIHCSKDTPSRSVFFSLQTCFSFLQINTCTDNGIFRCMRSFYQ